MDIFEEVVKDAAGRRARGAGYDCAHANGLIPSFE